MKANYRPRVRAGSVEAWGCAKAMVDEQIKRQIGSIEDARRREMQDYADALDATMLYTLHQELGLGASRMSLPAGNLRATARSCNRGKRPTM